MICTKEDEFLENKAKWVVELNNGETIFQDDDRPGLEPRAWFRLAKYLKENNLRIDKMYLDFRGHQRRLPDFCEGYFCSYYMVGDHLGNVQNCLVIGYLKDGMIHKEVWGVPELIPFEEMLSNPDEDAIAKKGGLIRNV